MNYSTTSEFLLTTEELHSVEGKWRCLMKLHRHPRRDLPEIQLPFCHLSEGISNLLICAHIKYTAAGRELVELGFRTVKKLEDIVIRVMVAGDSVENVAKRHMQILQEANVNESSL